MLAPYKLEERVVRTSWEFFYFLGVRQDVIRLERGNKGNQFRRTAASLYYIFKVFYLSFIISSASGIS